MRFESAKERAILAGIPVGSVPLGYRKREDRRMVIDPETAPIVAELFERRIAGEGHGALARFLRERTGHPWTRPAIPPMLANPLYHTGRVTHGSITSEFDAGAIVDTATWHAAQRPKHIQDGRTATGKRLLSGLLRCGSCGRRLTPWRPSRQATKGTQRRYRCTAESCENRVSVGANIVEDLDAAERRFEQVQSPEAQDALGEAWAATARARREERDAAAAALGEARQAAGVPEEGRVLKLGQIWEDLDPAQQREALAWHFDAVHVHKVGKGEKPQLLRA